MRSGTAQRTGFDLTGVGGHGQVGNGGVFGLTAAVRNNAGVTGAFGHLNGFQRLGQGADLVDLDQDGVGNPFFNAFFEDFAVGDEQIVADDLDFVAQFCRS